MIAKIEAQIDRAAANFNALRRLSPLIAEIARAWINVLKQGSRVFFCGNGGSAADAQHLAAELVGRYAYDRPPLPAVSLATDTSILTAVGNDYGFDDVFSRQILALGKPGDALVAISTSGNSLNVLKAAEAARDMSMLVVGFTGESGGELKRLADLCLAVPSSQTNYIQEMHIACGHIVCGLVEEALFRRPSA